MFAVVVIVPARRCTDATVSEPALSAPVVPLSADRPITSPWRTAHVPAASSSVMTVVANDAFVMRAR